MIGVGGWAFVRKMGSFGNTLEHVLFLPKKFDKVHSPLFSHFLFLFHLLFSCFFRLPALSPDDSWGHRFRRLVVYFGGSSSYFLQLGRSCCFCYFWLPSATPQWTTCIEIGPMPIGGMHHVMMF